MSTKPRRRGDARQPAVCRGGALPSPGTANRDRFGTRAAAGVPGLRRKARRDCRVALSKSGGESGGSSYGTKAFGVTADMSAPRKRARAAQTQRNLWRPRMSGCVASTASPHRPNGVDHARWPLARKAGFERLDVPQNIACSPLQDECFGGQPIKDVDTIGEVPRGGLLEIAAQ